MEEHHTPVQQGPAIVASSDKRSLSKKQKVWLSVAGVVALVGIGFGGFTFYNQVILNAAGEDSLGSDVVVDLPQANESPYFKITGVGRENIAIEPTGEARTILSPNTPSQVDVQKGWRIEQSTNPTDSSSWLVVMDANHSSSVGMDTNTCNTFEDVPKIQPNQTYYFRAAKLSSSSNTWEPQGNTVSVTTAPNPSLTVTNNDTQVTLSWTGDVVEPYECQVQASYTLARASSANAFANDIPDSAVNWSNNLSYSTSKGLVMQGIFHKDNAGALKAGSLVITQPVKSTFFYALLRDSQPVSNSQLSYKNISAVRPVNTGASTSIFGATTTLSNNTISINNFGTSSTKTTTTVKNTSFKWKPSSLITVKTWSPKTSSKYGPDCTVEYITSSGGFILASSQTASQFGNCTNVVPGTYPIKTTVVARNDSLPSNSPDYDITEQANDVQLTLQKISPNLQVNFQGSATVKYKKNVVISVYNHKVGSYSYLPEGTLVVKNLNTGKTIKTITLGTNVTSTKITLKGVKKGKYKLAVIYTASTKPAAIFENKTYNLPTLTVK